MAIRKIAQLGEPVLRLRAQLVPQSEVPGVRIQLLIEDMIETMRDADGAGLAAPQIYESLQICVIELDRNPRYPDVEPIPLTVLVNPVVTPLAPEHGGELRDDEAILMYEGCLSVQGVRGRVRRPRRVAVQALDRQGAPLHFVWEGVRAAVVQHETDHLQGVLFVDRAEPRSLTFLREYERYVPTTQRILDGGRKVS